MIPWFLAIEQKNKKNYYDFKKVVSYRRTGKECIIRLGILEGKLTWL